MTESVFKSGKSLAWVQTRSREYGSHQDYYPTHPTATRVLTTWIKEGDHLPTEVESVWECGAGEGHMADVLAEELSLPVFASDLVDRGQPDIHTMDFLTDWDRPVEKEAIITNPPFALAKEFALRALEAGSPFVAMLGNISFLGGRKRHAQLFTPYPLHRLLIIPERVAYAPGKLVGQGKNAAPFTSAWFIWKPAAQTECVTEFRSLLPGGSLL